MGNPYYMAFLLSITMDIAKEHVFLPLRQVVQPPEGISSPPAPAHTARGAGFRMRPCTAAGNCIVNEKDK